MAVELYLIIAFFIIYLITAFTLSGTHVKKIWTLAFILSFALTAGAIFMIRGNTQNVMLTTNEFNWYYFVYLFGMISIALGLLNLWIYRRPLWHTVFSRADSLNDEDDAITDD
ncbi:MAG: hypothetical protein IJ184_01005 [Alphaproteobacteria bacterium]|nr:hypothetical protein [Alphaproteobacteria bacterium]